MGVALVRRGEADWEEAGVGVIGSVGSLWRFPVKSMAGETLESAWLGFAGLYGDRIFAFSSDRAEAGFPWLTAREQRRMLLFRPRFRDREAAARPPNLAAAMAEAPGLSPAYADAREMMLDVELPSGEVLAIDDPRLAERLNERLGRRHVLRLLRSDRAFTDCRPLSLCSTATVARLERELGREVDPRRFRANMWFELGDGPGGAEDALVGRRLKVGPKAEITILERDPRCAMITLDPATAERDPSILAHISRSHDGKTGVYAAVLVEGMVAAGDSVALLD